MRFSPQGLLGNYWIAQPFRGRYQALQRLMLAEGIETLWIEDLSLIYHLTHQNFTQAILLASSSQPFELWLDGRYYGASVSRGWTKRLWDKKGPESLFAEISGQTLHCEMTLSYGRVEQIRRWAGNYNANVQVLSCDIQQVRMVKDAAAIEALEKSAELNDKGFRFFRTLLAPGVSEIELTRELEVFWLRHGADRAAFEPIVAFGSNGASPHHHSSQRRLRTGDLVLIDLGVQLDGYQSDMTRTFFYGPPEGPMVDVLESVHRAYELGVSLCRPGSLTTDIDDQVRKSLDHDGYGEFFNHNLGHGIGLQLHEAPYFRKGDAVVLQEGMLLTIEPGVYLQGKGGVRLENTVLITQNGAKVLSQVDILENNK